MEIIAHTLTTFIVFVSGLTGINQLHLAEFVPQEPQASVEFGLQEMSPNGADGGYAMPASGCSATNPVGNLDWGDGTHSDPIKGVTPNTCPTVPTITVDRPIVRQGDTVKISWNVNFNKSCILSSNVMDLIVSPLNVTSAVNPNINGSRNDQPQSMTTYTISCEGGSAAVTVKVTPRIVET